MSNVKDRIGWPVIFILTIVPIVLWLRILPLPARFFDWQTDLTSIGQLFGLTGMALFSLNLVLGARLKFLEKYFNGLNHIYINHHLVGGVALILLLFHPLLLVIKLIPFSLYQAALFFVPFADKTITPGIFSLLLMIILLAVTLYAKWPYQRWKLSHKFLGLAFFFGGLHMLLIPSDVSRDTPLRIYMSVLAAMGLGAVIYRSVLSSVLVKKYHYVVTGAKSLNAAVVEVELKASGKKLEYQPGQFLFISFRQEGIRPEYHPFTISSSPEAGNLNLTIKNLGDYTAALKDIKAGTVAMIEGPFGRFSFLKTKNKKQVWIAGGIGITPFLSMARSLGNHSGYNITLFYCTNTRIEAVKLDELTAIAANNNQLKVISFCSDERGRIDVKIIEKESAGLADKDIFICGPLPMMKSLKEQFALAGVPKARLHSEEFSL